MENTNLHKAKAAKNDEFYTQLTDVAKELMHYKKHFKDKIVFCNCDDPTWSAFWKYFHLNFAELGLKKLISTHYDREEATYKMEYTGGDDNDIEVDVKTPLDGNGDFRNQECLDLLVDKVSDIPCDYNGTMGVPITFLDKYNPEQFEIIGTISAACDPYSLNYGKDYSKYIGYKQDGTLYGRTGSTYGKCPVIVMDDKKHPFYEKDGIRVQAIHHRIFIRRIAK